MARSTIGSAPVPTFPLAKSGYDRDDESRFRSMVESALIDMTSSVERQLDGVLKFSADGGIALAPGVVIGESMDVAGQTFGTTVFFTALDFDTVQWTAGDVFLQDGVTVYSIDAGNTGNMTDDALRFIGIDVAISTTVLQVVTDMSLLVGAGRILMGWAKRTGTGPTGRAAFVPTIGELGLSTEQLGVGSVTSVTIRDGAVIADSIAANVIQGLHIQANTIQGVNIQGNTITGTHINGTTLSAIFADLGTVTAGLIEADVIIAADSFTATNASFSGNMDITGTLRVQANVTFDFGTTLTFTPLAGSPSTISAVEGGNELLFTKGIIVTQGVKSLGFSEFVLGLEIPQYTTAALPTATTGRIVFDTTEGVLKIANGSTWDEPGGGAGGTITGVNITGGTGLTGDVNTSTGQHTQTLNVIGGDGITANANDIEVDSTVVRTPATVVRTTGAQSIGGAKTFTDAMVATSIAASGEVTGFSTSDERLKTDIWEMMDPLYRLSLMRGVTFAWKEARDPEFHKPRRAGLIAQEVRAALPEAVWDGEDGMLKMQYEQIIPLLVAGINALRAEVEELRGRC